MTIPNIATYRLQLQPKFGFDDVCQWANYLKKLGISHVYTSPYLQPVEGSTHGYDVVDPTHVNSELGGEQAHAKMCLTFQRLELGHVIDIVPNHMAIAGQHNPWWWDVLENGSCSRYATYFDVDWENTEERWQNKILLPVLGNHYGRVLEAKELRLVHRHAHFALHYFDHAFPVDPSSLADLLARAAAKVHSDTLLFLAECYALMPQPSLTANDDIEKRHRDKAVLFQLLEQSCNENPEFCDAIDAEVARINDNVDALNALIDEQNYRLAFWRTASRDLGYRRFFDIADLAGLRIESSKVFKDTHALPIKWVKQGWVQGLRIDHSDGLRDPKRYFERLQEHCPDIWIVTEKILEPNEKLRTDWPIAGTTGYEFLNTCMKLFSHPDGNVPLTDLANSFANTTMDFSQLVSECKAMVLSELLQSELNRLTTLFVNICERHRRHRDFSKSELFAALAAVAQCFPVYRTYFSPNNKHPDPDDLNCIATAVDCAQTKHPDLDPELLEFLQEILCLRVPGNLEQELAMRFQQLTGPVMAKGVEDTALYRFNKLLALNEVGGDPGEFCCSLEAFHRFAANIHSDHPRTMLTSTTHDTKRSEDVRARLLVLSEVPQRWQQAINQWREIHAGQSVSSIPADVEYFIYQTLVGAWPISLDRMQNYMEKALREGKQYTSWTHQDSIFEANVNQFLIGLYNNPAFCEDITRFVNEIKIPGYLNSLSQTLIKLTAPGIPDIYQGNELWDFSLVDPDNRRLVDFSKRSNLLETLAHTPTNKILYRLEDGLPKMWLTHVALCTRARHEKAFSPTGMYQAIIAHGVYAGHIIAFSRGSEVITVAPRFNCSRPDGWLDTVLPISEGTWHNPLTQETIQHPGGTIDVAPLVSG